MTIAIPVKDDLAHEIRQVADQEGLQVEEFVEQALRRQLTLINRQKLQAENEAFRTMRAELEAQFPGKYVAIDRGKVVDHDTHRRQLYLRIRQKFGNTAVLIKQVTQDHERDLRFPSPWAFEKAPE